MALDAALRRTRLRRLLPRPEELRRRRREAGVSLADLAGELGVTAPAVLMWETGKRMPRDPAILERYLEVLGVLADEKTKR